MDTADEKNFLNVKVNNECMDSQIRPRHEKDKKTQMQVKIAHVTLSTRLPGRVGSLQISKHESINQVK